jgi:hypothetical protein
LFEVPTETENNNAKQDRDNHKYNTPPPQHQSRLAISATKSATKYDDVLNESYLNKAKTGEVKTATTSVSNQNCFTKGSNKRHNVADYANTGGGGNKKAKCTRTVVDGHRTKVDRPTLVGNANDSRGNSSVARMQSR